jgi:hypothetical protein
VDNADVMIMVDKKSLGIKGKGDLNGVAADMQWQEEFVAGAGKPLSHAVITARTEAQNIKKFGIDFDVQSSTPMPFTATYDRFADKSVFKVEADAQETQLSVPMLSYSKPAGSSAKINVALEWGGGNMRLSQLDVTGSDIALKGSGIFDAAQKLQKITFDPLRLGQNNVRLDYVNDARAPKITVTGDTLDIRKILDTPVSDSPKKSDSKPLQMDVKLKRLITGDKSQLSNLTLLAMRDAQGWAQLNLKATAQNNTPVSFSVTPFNGGRKVQGATQNLGHVLQSLGVTDTLIGGRLTIDGKSEANDPRAVFGHIKLTDYNIKNMPVLATLISAISPDGLAMLLTGQGLSFSELNGEYMWKGDLLEINKAHTSAGSLGLTTAGKLDLAASTLDLQGQVVPAYFISKILSNIPLIGDILTGGDGGGIFSATYTIKGAIAKPKVSVNPISVLAPGIIRNILFMDKQGRGRK